MSGFGWLRRMMADGGPREQARPLRASGPSTYVQTVNEGVFRTFQITHGATGKQVNARLRAVPAGFTGGQAAWETAAQTEFIRALDANHQSGVPNAAHVLFNAR